MRRSCSNLSAKKTSQNKNIVSTFVEYSNSELVFKKEKVLFFDIPIDSKQRKITRPIPFSFENRDKLKEQFKLKQSQLDKDSNKTTENQQNKQDTSKTKLCLPACSSTKKITNIRVQEKKLSILDEKSTKQKNEQSDIDATMTSEINLDQTGNIKPKSMTIGMNSYKRGKQRHEFDEKIKQKLAMQEKQREKEKAAQLAKEKLEVAMLRKQTVVKAKPMPVFKPLYRIKSTKPLTEPQSPDWMYKNKKKTS
ncbi:PREDICTED: targeting protein for Xklp2 homolog [Polistes dominula]|uniref:Targeting protein for Xklp2 homolog n=1 Tax=Polistes dominula TaxID=743375 RepID=A0ABM1I2F0_POLDO|nr:PREDICTED: targeting protein for Xklp2 homolog [Polistes dominula]